MLDRLLSAGRRFRTELRVYQLALDHPRTPKTAKLLLAAALGYAALPIDLIPDFIPLVGQIDDALIVPALVRMALRMIPPEVVEECRRRVKEAGG